MRAPHSFAGSFILGRHATVNLAPLQVLSGDLDRISSGSSTFRGWLLPAVGTAKA
jgi:hypothetical protein